MISDQVFFAVANADRASKEMREKRTINKCDIGRVFLEGL